jgi:hypothetical protein
MTTQLNAVLALMLITISPLIERGWDGMLAAYHGK